MSQSIDTDLYEKSWREFFKFRFRFKPEEAEEIVVSDFLFNSQSNT